MLESGLACSTLIVGNFGTNKAETPDLKTFKKSLLSAMRDGDEYKGTWDGGYYFDQYAFLTASTNSVTQPKTERYLKNLGFTPTVKTYNTKNGTNVRFWVIPVPVLVEKLKYTRPEEEEEETTEEDSFW